MSSKSNMQVHQLHPAVSFGDAIGNYMLEIRDSLKSLGYDSEVYAKYIYQNMPGIKDYREYEKISSRENILILHYSIGYDPELLAFIKSLPDKKIMIYHNITPSKYFHNINLEIEHKTRMGRKDLRIFKNLVNYALAVSEYNRKELVEIGFLKTGVLPIMVDFNKYDVNIDNNLNKEFNDDFVNILFVGRVSPHKKIEDIIKCFSLYNKYVNSKSRLFLIGSYNGMDAYHEKLKDLINKLELENIYFAGHVSFQELVSYYKLADVFLCMSEHEGFCVPLLESMFFEIPIIAYDSAAISDTLGNSGILVKDKRYEEIAEMINLLVEDKIFREKIINKQKERLKDFRKDKIEKILVDYLEEIYINKLNIRVEGTFEDSYSLSIVNRNLALALDRIGQNVSLYATSGNGDYVPAQGSITDARVEVLWRNAMNKPDFVIRNIYPPRVKDLKGRYNLIYFAWEESQIPKQWAMDFNKLDGIMVPSTFVKKVLEYSGVHSRIEVIPNCVDIDLFSRNISPMTIKTDKKFIFLNIGSGFPRKGIDVLITAYVEEFSSHDDVCLVLKTFPNIHNNISDLIKDATRPDGPEIVHIDKDMADKEIVSLYRRSDCFVSPTRGEGFGLPMAEAMICKIPVIATCYSGHLDFCNEKNSYLVDYKLVPSKSHVRTEYQIDNSLWAEPDIQHLKQLMRHVYENRDSAEIRNKVDLGYNNAVSNLLWDISAQKTVDFLTGMSPKIKLGIVSTWNTKCGIAEYTKYLVKELDSRLFITIFANCVDTGDIIEQDESNVIRCWDIFGFKNNLHRLYQEIVRRGLDVVHIQFNFGLFDIDSLAFLTKKLRESGIKTIITFHSVECYEDLPGERILLGNIKEELKLVDKIWVHSSKDTTKLSQIGIEDNVIMIPHGNKVYPELAKDEAKINIFTNSKIISTFGFLLPHKGTLEIIRALPQILKNHPNLIFLVVSSLYPNISSTQYYEKCKLEVKKLDLDRKVVFFTDFLAENEIMELLQASDMVLMPYHETKESASGAIRLALSSCRPVLTTKIPIFGEFDKEVFKIERCTPDFIARGVIELYEDRTLQRGIVKNARKFILKRSWKNIARKYQNLITTLNDVSS